VSECERTGSPLVQDQMLPATLPGVGGVPSMSGDGSLSFVVMTDSAIIRGAHEEASLDRIRND
jgi:hypothetical protein